MAGEKDVQYADKEGTLTEFQRLQREVGGLEVDDCVGCPLTALEASVKFARVEVVQSLVSQCPPFGSSNAGATAPWSAATLCKAYKELEADWTSDRQAIVRTLHNYRASIGSGYEPFHDPEVLNSAVMMGMESVVKLLIKRGADINEEESHRTPLTTALYYSQESIVRILVNAGALVGKRVSTSLPEEAIPLIFAADQRLGLSMRLLLERGASVHDVNAKGETVLMHATFFENPETIIMLLNAGAQIDAQSNSGETALMIAAYFSDEVAVRVLLDRGASVNLVNSKKETALMHVQLGKGGDSTMKLLLNAGSPVNAKSDSGETALMQLVRSWNYTKTQEPNQLNAISLLLGRGASIDQVNDQGWTALMVAAYKGRDQSVRILLEHGASIDAQANTGDTALTLAQKENHAGVINLLREYSVAAVNPSIRDECTTDAWGSLLKAATIGDDALVLRLLEAKAPIDKQTSTGETVLMRAVWNHQLQIVRQLINYGAHTDLLDNNKWSALLKAVDIGNDEITRLLVEAGAAIDAIGKGGNSALMLAASKGNATIVQILIDGGASVDLERPYGWKKRWTALMFASSGGFRSVVQLLINAGSAIYRSEDYQDDSSLTCAAENGHEEVVRMLIKHNVQVNAVDQRTTFCTSLECAIRNGHENVARILIDHRADPDQISVNGCTALVCAAENGRYKLIPMLLQCGASVDKSDVDGKTALMIAAQNGQEECIQELVKGDASIDRRSDRKYTALVYAAEGGHERCVRLLLQGGVYDIQDSQTAMMRAAAQGHEGCVLELLQAGVNVNSQTENGDTALMNASREGRAAVVKLLLFHGASTELEDSKHRTALILAASEGYELIVRYLIGKSALINGKASDGRSALSLAVEYGHESVIEILLKSGACVDFVYNKGRTALMLAAESGCYNVVSILLKYEAAVDAVDHEHLTAIMRAVLKGHTHIVRLLRDNGASLDIRNKDGLSAFMLAVDFGDNLLVRELLLDRSLLTASVGYLQSGMLLQHDVKVGKQGVQTQANESTTVTADLIELCNGMLGASDMCHQVYARLIGVESQISSVNKIAQRRLMENFMLILEPMHMLLVRYARKPTVSHIVSNDHIVETCQRTHQELDEFIIEHGLTSESSIHNWKPHFNENVTVYQNIRKSIHMDQKTLFDDLLEPEAQQEALVLLLFESSENRKFKYTEEEIDLMHKIFLHISSFSKLGISSVPTWFVPPQDVDIKDKIGEGSYASAHKGRWNSAKVVVKCPLLLDAQSRNMFLKEVDIWHKLQHPNVIQLYKACHVGKPFFVCEYAENGTLSNFLFEKDPAKAWEKLLQAARGLLYLHEDHNVVHGDLKCDNILIGDSLSSKDGPAKLADFGLSFKISDHVDPSTGEVGAIQWKAPEVVDGRTRGSLASDVYSFGICILEAVKATKGDGLPWGNFPDSTVKTKLRAKQLPKRPANVNDAQWKLISHMCAWEPSNRPSMKHVVDALQELQCLGAITSANI